MGYQESSTISLETLTYPAPNLNDYTLGQIVSERNASLDNRRHVVQPKYGLGVLEALPLEILQEILVMTDLRSLTDFRSANKRAVQVIDSIPQYRLILKHSPWSLQSILAIEIGSVISCRALFKTLITALCENCNDFAGYIYLPTCARVCFLCMTEETRYLPLLAGEVKRRFGLPHSVVVKLPGLTSIPGRYSPNDKIRRSRLRLYDHTSARQTAEAYHGSVAVMQQRVAAESSRRLAEYENRLLEMLQGHRGSKPRRPPDTVGYDGLSSNPRRFMAVVGAPWLDIRTNTEEWGFHCVGCEDHHCARPCHWRRRYIESTFRDHIGERGQIVRGIHCRTTATSVM